MSATKEKKQSLLPPEELFWQRYSPHHEFPLAGVTSLFLHGMVIGIVVVAGLLMLMRWESDTGKPPSMDVVQLSGMGDGMEGAGGEPGLPGEPNAGPKEDVANFTIKASEAVPEANLLFKDTPNLIFDIPDIGPMVPKTDIDNLLSNLGKDAEDQAKKENAPPKKSAKIEMPGTGNPKGAGGQGGSGGGPGKGTKGTGMGIGGPLGGRKATKAEVYAWRWRFDLTGGGQEHANKLAAFGITLAIPAPTGKFLFIQDLRRRPVDLQPGNIEKFKDAVKWRNTDPGSMQELAKELRLPFVPSMVIMLLPRDREDKMAAEELRFAQQSGRSPQQIQATWFDFRLQEGKYEPVVIRQQ